jgi:hypothetical protein
VKKFGIKAITEDLLSMDITMNISISGVGNVSPQEQINNFIRAMEALRCILGRRAGEVRPGRARGDRGAVRQARAQGRQALLQHGRHRPAPVRGDADDRPAAAAARAEGHPELVAAQVRKLDAEIEQPVGQDRRHQGDGVEKTGRTVFAAGQTAQMLAAVPQLGPLIDAVLQLVGYQEPAGASLPVGDQPLAGETQTPVKNPRTGIKFLPGAGGAAAGDTSPNTPANPKMPASPGTGADAGIETVRSPG